MGAGTLPLNRPVLFFPKSSVMLIWSSWKDSSMFCCIPALGSINIGWCWTWGLNILSFSMIKTNAFHVTSRSHWPSQHTARRERTCWKGAQIKAFMRKVKGQMWLSRNQLAVVVAPVTTSHLKQRNVTLYLGSEAQTINTTHIWMLPNILSVHFNNVTRRPFDQFD